MKILEMYKELISFWGYEYTETETTIETKYLTNSDSAFSIDINQLEENGAMLLNHGTLNSQISVALSTHYIKVSSKSMNETFSVEYLDDNDEKTTITSYKEQDGVHSRKSISIYKNGISEEIETTGNANTSKHVVTSVGYDGSIYIKAENSTESFELQSSNGIVTFNSNSEKPVTIPVRTEQQMSILRLFLSKCIADNMHSTINDLCTTVPGLLNHVNLKYQPLQSLDLISSGDIDPTIRMLFSCSADQYSTIRNGKSKDNMLSLH